MTNRIGNPGAARLVITLASVAAAVTAALPAVATSGPAAEQVEAVRVVRASVSSAEAEGNHHSFGGAVSANGRFIAFASQASNLVPGDTNDDLDVFVRDVREGTTERVSLRSSGAQTTGLYETRYIALSPGGRFVAFTTDARLVRGDRNGIDDVYIHDRTTGRTERASVTSRERGRTGCEWCSTGLGVSAGGRYVAFNTDKRLTPNASGFQLFVRDRTAGTTRLVSVNNNGRIDNGIAARGANITPDGRYVTWHSDANNLVPRDTNGTEDVFVRDLLERRTERVSVNSLEQQGNDYSAANEVQISANGRFVLFGSAATNLVPNDTNTDSDLFVRDRLVGTTERVTVNSAGEEANEPTWLDSPFSISAGGRYVAFATSASNLVVGDSNGDDVFVRDRQEQTTTRISLTPTGDELSSGAWGGDISADGSVVAFESRGGRVVTDDTNRRSDVFAYYRAE